MEFLHPFSMLYFINKPLEFLLIFFNMIDWASLAERAKEQHMKNYRFRIRERDNNNKTPKGKQFQYNAYMLLFIAFQIGILCACVYIYLKTSLLNLLSKTIKIISYTVISRAVHLLNLTSVPDLSSLYSEVVWDMPLKWSLKVSQFKV